MSGHTIDAGGVTLTIADSVARVTLSNPGKRNALTWPMYDQLLEAFARVGDDASVRVVALRGAAGDGFAAGTDIRQFADFVTGDDGVDYEHRVEAVLGALLALRMPVVAVVDGAAVGAGLALAACCDIVVAERGARFGAPIGRTLGNCLPIAVVRRLRQRLGAGVSDFMLLSASLMTAETLAASGFVAQLAEPGELDAVADKLLSRITTLAPLTVAALKETGRRLETAGPLPDSDDLLRACYGSEDFHEGVAAFLEQRRSVWKGR